MIAPTARGDLSSVASEAATGTVGHRRLQRPGGRPFWPLGGKAAGSPRPRNREAVDSDGDVGVDKSRREVMPTLLATYSLGEGSSPSLHKRKIEVNK